MICLVKYEIERKDKTPMPKNMPRRNRILIFAVIFSMALLCSFSHSEGPEYTLHGSNAVISGVSYVYPQNTIKPVDGAKLLLSNTVRFKSSEEAAGLKDSRRGDYSVWYLICLCAALLVHMLYMLLHTQGWSELTPRYSVISYLHRSDGKKPASVILLS